MEEDIEQRRRAAQTTEAKVRALLPHVHHLTAPDFAAISAGSAEPLLLDVRTPDEASCGTLRNAQHADSQPDIEALARSAAAAGRPVVAFCTVGLRSGALVDRLRRAGVPASNYSVLTHVWAGEPLHLPREDGERSAAWDASVHAFSSTYAAMWPPGLSVSVFSPVRAAWEAVRAAPPTIAALMAARFVGSPAPVLDEPDDNARRR